MVPLVQPLRGRHYVVFGTGKKLSIIEEGGTSRTKRSKNFAHVTNVENLVIPPPMRVGTSRKIR